MGYVPTRPLCCVLSGGLLHVVCSPEHKYRLLLAVNIGQRESRGNGMDGTLLGCVRVRRDRYGGMEGETGREG